MHRIQSIRIKFINEWKKEENPNLCYHTIDTIDNESNKFLVKIANQEYALFKNDGNNQDEKLNGNSNFINNIRYKKDISRYMAN